METPKPSLITWYLDSTDTAWYGRHHGRLVAFVEELPQGWRLAMRGSATTTHATLEAAQAAVEAELWVRAAERLAQP